MSHVISISSIFVKLAQVPLDHLLCTAGLRAFVVYVRVGGAADAKGVENKK